MIGWLLALSILIVFLVFRVIFIYRKVDRMDKRTETLSHISGHHSCQIAGISNILDDVCEHLDEGVNK